MKIHYESGGQQPAKQHEHDACWDIRTDRYDTIPPQGIKTIYTGMRIGIPEGYAGLVMSRSGLASRGVFVLNAPGIIDAGYDGEIMIIMANLTHTPHEFIAGDRVAQLMLMKLEDYFLIPGKVWGGERGDNGLGSTGD